MTKLFEVAKLSGQMLETAAVRAAELCEIDADRSMLLNAKRHQLIKERDKTMRKLIALANRGNSIPAKEHEYLIGRHAFIKFLLAPTKSGDASLQWGVAQSQPRAISDGELDAQNAYMWSN